MIGDITIDSDKIHIKTAQLSRLLPLTAVHRIRYHIRPYNGRSYFPTFFHPIGYKVRQGTGNVIEIETADKKYRFDLLLSFSTEYNSFETQIKRLADSGVIVQKLKAASLLGDHF